ncbi:MAG TPA: aminotransferase class I/II-fold pyridoxal phosphate-dependent enzyme [Acidimicrobiales bacterium]|nr:aminotransferase class I/II-fold pyridoxal phosphate-dependent enzyme [Acidimicrobiales bacterium]
MRVASSEAASSGSGVDLDRYGAPELRARAGAKWSSVGPDGLAAGLADMDFPLAPAVRDALIDAVRRDDLGYPSPRLAESCRQAFARRYAERHGLEVDPGCVVLTSDVVQAIYAAVWSLTAEGDGVVFLTPSYPPFFDAVRETRRRVLTADLVAGPSGYELDLERLGDLVARERPRCLLLCNPHNPTGRAFRREELAALGALACEHDLLVVADEIHADLVLPGASHVPIASLDAEVARRCVTLSSASKAFNVAGLRCAFAAFPSRDLLEAFDVLPAAIRGSVSVAGMHATLAAFSAGDAWLDAVLRRLAVNRAEVVRALGSLAGVRVHPPEATYLAWLDLRAAGLGDDPAEVIARRSGVVCSSGPSFGPAGRGHVRLNFATSAPVLEEICRRVAAVIRSSAPSSASRSDRGGA